MNERYSDAVQQLSKIRWENIGLVENESNVALAKEYVRRAALLIKTYNLDVKFPFFSAAQAFGKNPQIDILKASPQIGDVENAFVRKVCECYLEWSALADMNEPVAIEFCDLYEPLIKLFERGGLIGLHHGEIVVGKYAFPLRHWSKVALETPIDISDEGFATWDR